MQNQLSRIGMLVLDLKAGKGFEELGITLEYLEKEFNTITMQLVSTWFLGLPSLPYQLDFHAAETARLMGLMEDLELEGDLLQLHPVLMRQLRALAIQLDRLDGLRFWKPVRI